MFFARKGEVRGSISGTKQNGREAWRWPKQALPSTWRQSWQPLNIGNNKVTPAEIPALIGSVHAALTRLESGKEIRAPAVPIGKSVKRNEVICLECGNGHKMLKRHLSTAHGLVGIGPRWTPSPNSRRISANARNWKGTPNGRSAASRRSEDC